MKGKLTSRKFWICVAAFLASVGSSIAGLATSNHRIAVIGIVCTVLSSAIYAAAEAYVDSARAYAQMQEGEAMVNAIGYDLESDPEE